MREGTITVTASLGKAGATIKKVNHMELSFFLSVFLFCTTFSCGIPGRGAFSQRNAVVGGRLLPGFADELSIRGGKKTPQSPSSAPSLHESCYLTGFESSCKNFVLRPRSIKESVLRQHVGSSRSSWKVVCYVTSLP